MKKQNNTDKGCLYSLYFIIGLLLAITLANMYFGDVGILIAVLAFILLFFYLVSDKDDGKRPKFKEDGLPIVGISFRNLDEEKHTGTFNGFAEAQHDNKHDPYAIAIYIVLEKRAKHVGFLRGGNVELHEKITEAGGRIGCECYIDLFEDRFGVLDFYGRVILEKGFHKCESWRRDRDGNLINLPTEESLNAQSMRDENE